MVHWVGCLEDLVAELPPVGSLSATQARRVGKLAARVKGLASRLDEYTGGGGVGVCGPTVVHTVNERGGGCWCG